jgi:TolA-binding protein
VLVVAAAAAALSTAGHRTAGGAEPFRAAGGDEVASPGSAAVARVALAEGGPVLVRAGRRTILAETDEVRAGDTIEGPEGSAVGLSYADGTALVMEGEARLNVREADGSGIRVGLVYGTLAARVPPGSREGAPLRVSGSNATLVVRGTVFTVSAERGHLTGAAVSEGTVEVRSRTDDRVVRVGRLERLDMRDWSVSEGRPDASALARLARITSGVEVPCAEEASGTGEQPGAKAPSVADRIRNALERGDVDAAVALADKHGSVRSLAFLMAAAEAYRRAGRWSDATDAYLAGAGAGKGKMAEKAMLRAADITLRKLLEPKRAASIIDDYLARFPTGSHLDEGLYLGGMANTRSGNYKKARSQLETYLARYPGGAQVMQVHVTLAKIYAFKMSDCASASKHIAAVKSKGKAMADEAAKIEARCKKTPTGGEK